MAIHADHDVVFPYPGFPRGIGHKLRVGFAMYVVRYERPCHSPDVEVIRKGEHGGARLVRSCNRKHNGQTGVLQDWFFLRGHGADLSVPMVSKVTPGPGSGKAHREAR